MPPNFFLFFSPLSPTFDFFLLFDGCTYVTNNNQNLNQNSNFSIKKIPIIFLNLVSTTAATIQADTGRSVQVRKQGFQQLYFECMFEVTLQILVNS